MRLIPIWEQGGESLCDYYEAVLARRGERFREYAERMTALIRAVEAEVQAPEHYCTISHDAFYMTEEDYWFRLQTNAVERKEAEFGHWGWV